jgi:multiple sugar transport system permease protein
MTNAGKSSRSQGSVSLTGYLFLLPYLALFITFLLIPLGYGLWLSLSRYELATRVPPSFIGIANYLEALQDPYFWQSLGVTALFVVLSVPLTVVIALLIAAGINAVRDSRQAIYRLGVFLPTVLTVSVVSILWLWFYNDEFGLFNSLLDRMHLGHVPWITSKLIAMPSIVLMSLWWTIGGPMVILLAGLQQIPDSYHEAAAIDGATGVRRFFSITLPLLRPVLLFVIVINIIGGFQLFGQTFLVTHGGPELATRSIVQYIYETGFQSYRLGYSAAMSWLLFIVIAIFSIVQFKLMQEK